MLALKTGVCSSSDRPRAGPSSCCRFLKKSLGTQYSLWPSSFFLTRAAESSTTQTSTSAKAVVPDDEFSLAKVKVSFGAIGMGSGGLLLLSYGFGAYFNILTGLEWSAIMLRYGFPLGVIGLALEVHCR